MTTSLHFGPEWMRDKRTARSRASQDASPPPGQTPLNGTSYSSVLTPTNITPQTTEVGDSAHPFRYAKDDILQVWRDGGGRTGLGLEVERWEGIIREYAGEPIGIKDMSDSERKLFVSVNSDLRRRGTHDSGSGQAQTALTRPKPGHIASQDGYGRDKGGSLLNRKKRESIDSPAPLARKLSLNMPQSDSSASTRDATLTSPRIRQANPTQNLGSAGSEQSPWGLKRVFSASLAKKLNSNLSEEETSSTALDTSPFSPTADHPNPAPNYIVPHEGVTQNEGPNTFDRAIRPLQTQSGIIAGASLNEDIGERPPPGLVPVDPAVVQWTYIDPTGKVQGPFPADTMQKWNDQGYFHMDLPMRREGVDEDYLPLGQLFGLSQGPSFFLSSFPPVHRPIPPFSDPLVNMLNTQHHFQDSRVDNLDSYRGLAPLHTESPTLYNQPFVYAANREHPGHGYQEIRSFQDNRWPDQQVQENVLRHHSPASLGGLTQSMSASSSQYTSPQVGVIGRTVVGQQLIGSSDTTEDATRVSPWNATNGMLGEDHGHSARILQNNYPDSQLDQATIMASNGSGHLVHPIPLYTSDFSQVTQPHYNIAPGTSPFSSRQIPPPLAGQSGADSFSVQLTREINFGSTQNTTTPEFLNRDQTSGALHQSQLPEPMSASISAGLSIQSSVRNEGGVQQMNSPPGAYSQAIAFATPSEDDRQDVSEMPVIPKNESKTASPPREFDLSQDVENSVSDVLRDLSLKEPLPEIGDTTSFPPTSSTETMIETSAEVPSTPNAVQARAKAPWAISDSTSIQAKTQVPGFRQIQQIEMKKEEERKAAERKSRATSRSVTSAQQPEEVLVGAWGLPSSQAGSRTAKEKEGPAPVPVQAPSGPVWTNVVRPRTEKKSMKEILEEEKRQQNFVREKDVAAANSKRGYAESATKNAISTAEINQSGWTTVGSSGKAAPGTASSPTSNPTSPPSTATGLTSARPSSTAKVTNRISQPPNGKNVLTKLEEPRHDPSLEFLRWLRDSLKGLNGGVNVDEFIQMLLSFPVEASQDTIDLIQEQAYANSTTIDGRRFAADFIARRRADILPHAQGNGNGVAKGTSLADVVKAPAKTQASDWGYKVVKKKGKGGKGR